MGARVCAFALMVLLCGVGCGGAGDEAGGPSDPGPDGGGGPSPDATPEAPGVDARGPVAPTPRDVPDDGSPLTSAAYLRVVDEAGAPLPGARVDVGVETLVADERGEVLIAHYRDPVVAVASADGFLPEPVVVGHADHTSTVIVRLLSRLDGSRWALHAAGDVMLTRRFYDGVGQVEPLIDPADVAGGARYVVEPVARAFAAADVSTVNLETVLGTLPESAAYPEKGVIIGSHPDTLAGLDSLGVDVVVLGNNHIYDYLGQGVDDTLAALDAAGLPYVGAARDGEAANEPLIVEAGGVRVGVLSYSTLSGNSNNDRYPEDGDAVPPELDPEDAWQYEARLWGFEGETLSVPEADRRIGSAWRLFHDAEADLSEAEAAAAWSSLYAVYPELQDYVARRGHGGAAYWTTSGATADIAALAGEVELVVVQVHGGAEFQPAPSRLSTEIARAAIDAGADLVVDHHPHILQGLEWYKGRLIAHSMGNFVFDQEEHRATPTAFLRTVWDGATLVEARLVPLDLGGYRPSPLADAAAERHLRDLWEQNLLGTVSGRDGDGDFRSVLEPLPADSAPVHIRVRHHDAVLTAEPPAVKTLALELPAGASMAVADAGLIHARAGGAAVLLGRELYGWGDFEDGAADDMDTHAVHWQLGHEDATLHVDADAATGVGYATLFRDDGNMADATAVPLTRVPIPEHRVFRDDGDQVVPADGAASYTIRFRARMEGESSAYVRVDLYPDDGLSGSGGKKGEIALEVDIAADGAWHDYEVEVPVAELEVASARMTAIRPHFRLRAPDAGECTLAIDDVRIIEWRPAADMPDHFGAYDYVQNPAADDLAVTLEVLPLRDL